MAPVDTQGEHLKIWQMSSALLCFRRDCLSIATCVVPGGVKKHGNIPFLPSLSFERKRPFRRAEKATVLSSDAASLPQAENRAGDGQRCVGIQVKAKCCLQRFGGDSDLIRSE